MAGFLRRKFTQESKPNPTSNRPVHSTTPTSSHASPTPPPLFAKFATTYQVTPDSKPSSTLIVSSPMPLGLANPTRRKLDPDLEISSKGVNAPKALAPSSEHRSVPDRLPQAEIKRSDVAPGGASTGLVTSQSTYSIATTAVPTPPAQIRHGKLSKSTPRPASRALFVDKPLPDPRTSDPTGAPHLASPFPPNRHIPDNIVPSRVQWNGYNSTPATRDVPSAPSTHPEQPPFRPVREVQHFTQADLSNLDNNGRNPANVTHAATSAVVLAKETPNVELASPPQPTIQPAPQQPPFLSPMPTRRVLPKIPQPTHIEKSPPSLVDTDLQSPPSVSATHTPLHHDLQLGQSSLSDIDPGPTTFLAKSTPGRPNGIKIAHDAISQAIDDFPVAFRRGDRLDGKPDASMSDITTPSTLTMLNDEKDFKAASSGLPSPSKSPKARRVRPKSIRQVEVAPPDAQPQIAPSRSAASQIAEEFRSRSLAQNSQSSSFHTPVDESPMGVSSSSLTAHALHSVSPDSPGPRSPRKSRHMTSLSTVEKSAGQVRDDFQGPPLTTRHRKATQSVQYQQTGAPMPGKPLIFAAMATVEHSDGPRASFIPPPLSPSRPSDVRNAAPYPSPPPQDDTPPRVQKLQPSPRRPFSMTVQPAAREAPPAPSLYPNAVASTLNRVEGHQNRQQPPAQPHDKLRSRMSPKSGPVSDISSPHPHANGHAVRALPDPHVQAPNGHRVLAKVHLASPVSPTPPPPREFGQPWEMERGTGEYVIDYHGAVSPKAEIVELEPRLSVNSPTRSNVIPDTETTPPADVLMNTVAVEEPEEMGEILSDVDSTTTTAVMNGPSTLSSAEDYHPHADRRGSIFEEPHPSVISKTKQKQSKRKEAEPGPFPLALFVADAHFLSSFLSYLSFYDWCILSSVSKDIRTMLGENADLKEEVLERYLRTVGYARWSWSELEPLTLTLQDLNDYMRGVSTPTHQYARIAESYLQSRKGGWTTDGQARASANAASELRASSRAYTRVVLRLRAQAETESNALAIATSDPIRVANVPQTNGFETPQSRTSHGSSRAPSPSPSLFSRSYYSRSRQSHSPTHNNTPPRAMAGSSGGPSFRSPLFRLQRAPLLRVFVPSPDGDWLSDASVLECEAELRRSGVAAMLRAGDIVWDVAVGDEGNVGRMVWDGGYLIDLDYSYSAVGDIPKYIPTLAFSPSYFHRVLRTGPSANNPIVHMDISPWGEEIAANLQLLQERVRTETPQGAYHNVIRWVHRSCFVIRPPPPVMTSRSSNQVYSRSRPHAPRIPIPGTDGLCVDVGWYGTIIVETEGTNEGLADLQDRCGSGAFPFRAGGMSGTSKEKDCKKVFRLLREKSQPGEIWIKTVR